MTDVPEEWFNEGRFMAAQIEAIAEAVEEARGRVEKEARRYITDPSQAPEGAEIKRGERGGIYYVPTGAEGGEWEAPEGEHPFLHPEFVNWLQQNEVDKLPPPNIDPSTIQVFPDADPKRDALIKWRDTKGRLQSGYSQEFHDRNAAIKWARVEKWRAALPEVKEQLYATMQASEPGSTEHDAAAIAAVIAETGLRPGSPRSAKKGKFGISTLQTKHVSFSEDGSEAYLKFKGKSGVKNTATVSGPAAEALGRAVQAAEAEGRGNVFNAHVKSARELLPGDLKLKDFRTIHATTLAEQTLDSIEPPPPLPEDEKEAKKAVAEALREASDRVADALNNTRAVAKASYIHPQVFDKWLGQVGGEALAKAESDYDPEMDEVEWFPVPDWLEEEFEAARERADAGVEKSRSPVPKEHREYIRYPAEAPEGVQFYPNDRGMGYHYDRREAPEDEGQRALGTSWSGVDAELIDPEWSPEGEERFRQLVDEGTIDLGVDPNPVVESLDRGIHPLLADLTDAGYPTKASNLSSQGSEYSRYPYMWFVGIDEESMDRVAERLGELAPEGWEPKVQMDGQKVQLSPTEKRNLTVSDRVAADRMFVQALRDALIEQGNVEKWQRDGNLFVHKESGEVRLDCPLAKEGRQYCDIPGHCFPSPQGLGGHVAQTGHEVEAAVETGREFSGEVTFEPYEVIEAIVGGFEEWQDIADTANETLKSYEPEISKDMLKQVSRHIDLADFDSFRGVGDSQDGWVMNMVLREWKGTPSDPATLQLWAYAAIMYQNQNIPPRLIAKFEQALDHEEDAEFWEDLGLYPDRAKQIAEHQKRAQKYAREFDPTYDPETDTVMMYRGVDGGFAEDLKSLLDDAEELIMQGKDTYIRVFHRTLESWTASPNAAKGFGDTVFATRVPVDNIVSAWTTNSHYLKGEAEYIVATPNGKAYYDADDIKTMVKYAHDELDEAYEETKEKWKERAEEIVQETFGEPEEYVEQAFWNSIAEVKEKYDDLLPEDNQEFLLDVAFEDTVGEIARTYGKMMVQAKRIVEPWYEENKDRLLEELQNEE